MKNPMLDLYHNVVPLLKSCGSGDTSANCFCTDPSVSYSQPCVIASTGTSSPIDSTSRAQCTYSTPTVSQATVKPSTGGGLGSKPNVQFKVKPGNSSTEQPFTQAGNPQTLNNGGQPTYPNSLLFCQNFKKAGGQVTSSTPALAYSTSQGQFTPSSWTNSGDSNKTTNRGFA